MPQYWYIVEALIALARNRRDGRKPFTRADLRAWSDKIKARPRSAQIALDHLEAYGFVRRGRPHDVQVPAGQWSYMLTPEGRAAATTADAARFEEEKALRDAQEPGSFQARVYALLRARRALTGIEAAETLVDAGADVRDAAKRAAACMRAWSKHFPDAIQPSALRVRGSVRFVLVQDIGPLAPVIAAPSTRARGGAIA